MKHPSQVGDQLGALLLLGRSCGPYQQLNKDARVREAASDGAGDML